MRLAYWLRLWAPFLVGCFAGLCLAIGILIAVRLGVAAFDRDWGYVAYLAVSSACFACGGWLVITNGMEIHQ